jgi:hypothetical protein
MDRSFERLARAAMALFERSRLARRDKTVVLNSQPEHGATARLLATRQQNEHRLRNIRASCSPSRICRSARRKPIRVTLDDRPERRLGFSRA